MQHTEVQQILLTLIKHAQSAKFTEFQFLQNLSEYNFYKGKSKSYRILIKILKKSVNKLFRSYCKKIPEGTANFNSLLAYKQINQTIDFYKRELEIIGEMLDEYEAYLLSGYFFCALTGECRREEDLKDFREQVLNIWNLNIH